MITIPSHTKTGFAVRRVTLLHSGGIGSTLVLYYLMKDIIDRNLNVGLNVVTLDKPGDPIWNTKDVHFAVSSALKCQELLGFDSDKLIIQGFYPHMSIDSEFGRMLNLEFFNEADPDSDAKPLSRRTLRGLFSRHRGGPYYEYDSEDGTVFEDFLINNDSEFRWENNILYRDLYLQLLDADSDGDSDLARSIIASYPDYYYSVLCQFLGGFNVTDVIYNGEYRNPPVSVQNNFKYGFGLNFTRPEANRGASAVLDSEVIVIDSELCYVHPPTGKVNHWYEIRPLLSKGDARDLYNNYYSQDSDLQELFWYTMSCNTWWRREYRENEIYEDSELPIEWDSDSLLWDNENNQYIYQTRQQPLHKFLPHCRKCWQCQNRGYGFEAWLDSEDDIAWMRIENKFNPAQDPVPTDAIVIYDLRNGASLPGPTETDIKNLGSIDGIGSFVGSDYSWDSENGKLILSGVSGNNGIVTQNLRPYLDSDGTMSLSVWFTLKRTTGTILADIPTISNTTNYTGILEVSEGTFYSGFANKDGVQEISGGTIDSETLTNITLTFDGDVFTMYQNGSQVAQQSGISRLLFSDSSHSIEVGFGNNNISYYFSGGVPFADPGSNDLYGELKRFTYFNRSLSSSEVRGLYSMESLLT